MNFEEELKMMLEYCDYSAEGAKRIEEEAKGVRMVYQELKPNRGWGSNHEHSVSFTGHLVVGTRENEKRVPFGICYPVDYPSKPPICTVITGKNQVLVVTPGIVSSDGRLTVEALKNWNSSIDSLEVISQCVLLLEKHRPWINIERVYLEEMWKVRRRIDEIKRDKVKLEAQLDKVKKAERSLDNVTDNKSLERLESRLVMLEEALSEQCEITMENAFVYKNHYGEQLLDVAAEIEATDEVLCKLDEAFNRKVIGAEEYFIVIKKLFGQKFLLDRLKTKIVSLIN